MTDDRYDDDHSYSDNHKQAEDDTAVEAKEKERLRKLIKKESNRVRSASMLALLAFLIMGTIACVMVFLVLLLENEQSVEREVSTDNCELCADFHKE